MHFLSQYGMFLLKTITIVIAILLLSAGLLSLNQKPTGRIKIKSLNRRRDETKKFMLKEILDTKEKRKKDKQKKPCLFVLDFNGDIKASQVEQLREEINAVLLIATPADEILIRLESPGGAVNGYGLAASQLKRIRDKNIPLTVCIDKVAASGGYLMACVANKIIAAPFSIIGSIGVVAQIPNFHRLLKKNDIDLELLTAGEYKRTLTMFAENTQDARQKFQEDIDVIHSQFKDYVLQNRPQMDIQKISTGEHWLAVNALDLKLIDELQTSDSYLEDKMLSYDSYQVVIKGKTTFADKLIRPVMKLFNPWA